MGDINGDGYADFVGATFSTGSDHYARIFFGGPQETVDPASADFADQLARNDAVLNRHVVTLKLPAPLSLTGSGTGNFTAITSGDFNDDGLSDMVFTVSGGAGAGLYTILGRRDAFSIEGGRKLLSTDTVPSGTTFALRIDDGVWRSVTLTSAAPETLVPVSDLVQRLNAAIDSANLRNSVIVEAVDSNNVSRTVAQAGDGIRFRLTTGRSLQLALNDSVSDPMKLVLGFRDEQRNAWSSGVLATQALDILVAHDARIALATATGGLVGNVHGTADEANNPGAIDIVAGTVDGVPAIYAGDSLYRPSRILWSSDFSNARGEHIDEGIESKTGLWNRTTRRSDGAAANGPSFYYGRALEGNYDVGTSSGALTTHPIDLTGESASVPANDVVLSFSYWLQTENGGLATEYDKARSSFRSLIEPHKAGQAISRVPLQAILSSPVTWWLAR